MLRLCHLCYSTPRLDSTDGKAEAQMGKKVGEITMEYFLAEKTEQLIRGFFAVQNEVGLGRNEEAYQRAFEIWTHEEKLPIARIRSTRIL